jgi:RNA polymerase sigma-70 factor, ECF subfamily
MTQSESPLHPMTPDAPRCAGKQGLAMRPDEELLLDYAQTGNRAAFEELVHRHERKLHGYLRAFLGDAQLAEDAFQGTFLQVHLKCRQFEAGRRLGPWLYKIATNQAHDLLRRNRRHRAVSLDGALCGNGRSKKDASLLDFLTDGVAGPAERLESAEDRQRIWSAVEQLPTHLKELLILVMFQGLKYREAADVLEIPVGTVKSRMHDAIGRLHATFIAAAPIVKMRTEDDLVLQKAS